MPSRTVGAVPHWPSSRLLGEEVDEVHFQVESELHPKAGRVRPAWKLFDTLEVPKESDMKALSSEVSMGIDLGESLVDSVLSGGLSVSFSMEMGTQVSPGLGRSLAVKRHAAATLPTAYIAAVVDGPLEPLSEPRCELVWEPGMPLPTASAAPGWGTPSADARVAPPQNPQRTCYACGFQVPRVEYERATICPRCEAAGCRHGLPERRSTHSSVKHSPSLGMPMALPARLHTARR